MASVSRKSCVLLAAGLVVACGGLAGAQDTDRDPSELLKRTRETPRRYDKAIDIDFQMMEKGQANQKKEQRIAETDIPEARNNRSFPGFAEPPPTYYPPPVTPLREEDIRKKNWILPPQPKLHENTDRESDNPTDAMLRMLQDDDDARRSALEDLFSRGSKTQYPGREDGAEDETRTRYSEDDGNVREATDNFLYRDEETEDASAVGTGTGFSPVIMDTVFDDRGDTTKMRSGDSARLNPDQLDQLSNEELAELAGRQALADEDEAIGIEEVERLSGIEQYTRNNGLDQDSGLRQVQAILSGTYASPTGDGAEPAPESAGAATLGDNSWRGTLSTLSSVLNTVPAGQAAAAIPTGVPGGGASFGGARDRNLGMDRIREPFSFGGDRSASGGYTPAASTGLGNLSGSFDGPTSLDLGSRFSSGTSRTADVGLGGRTMSFSDAAPSREPAPSRRIDVRNLDILMK